MSMKGKQSGVQAKECLEGRIKLTIRYAISEWGIVPPPPAPRGLFLTVLANFSTTQYLISLKIALAPPATGCLKLKKVQKH